MQARNVIIPISSRATHHWALAVVRPHSIFVDIFDSLASALYLLPLYPALVKWSNFIRGILNSRGDWVHLPKICSIRKEICDTIISKCYPFLNTSAPIASPPTVVEKVSNIPNTNYSSRNELPADPLVTLNHSNGSN